MPTVTARLMRTAVGGMSGGQPRWNASSGASSSGSRIPAAVNQYPPRNTRGSPDRSAMPGDAAAVYPSTATG
jgi:hypothetical protein